MVKVVRRSAGVARVVGAYDAALTVMRKLNQGGELNNQSLRSFGAKAVP